MQVSKSISKLLGSAFQFLHQGFFVNDGQPEEQPWAQPVSQPTHLTSVWLHREWVNSLRKAQRPVVLTHWVVLGAHGISIALVGNQWQVWGHSCGAASPTDREPDLLGGFRAISRKQGPLGGARNSGWWCITSLWWWNIGDKLPVVCGLVSLPHTNDQQNQMS